MGRSLHELLAIKSLTSDCAQSDMESRPIHTVAGVAITISAAVMLSAKVGSRVWIAASAMGAFFGVVWLVVMYISKKHDKIEELHLIERDLRHQADLHADSNDDLDD